MGQLIRDAQHFFFTDLRRLIVRTAGEDFLD
jgi:hypothetical protein